MVEPSMMNQVLRVPNRRCLQKCAVGSVCSAVRSTFSHHHIQPSHVSSTMVDLDDVVLIAHHGRLDAAVFRDKLTILL
jgi:hypothetical protein